MEPLARKVLLIGWDAADWRVIDPLLEQGKLPNLAGFLAAGVRGNIATLHPALSPMLWTSIATGKRPYKHGIHGFSEPTPDGRGIRPISNLARTTKAVWNILHQAGKTSNVVGWWPSHPAEPIRGVMVSNHYQQARGRIGQPWPMPPGTVHPPRLARPLEEFRLHPAELDETHIAPFVPHFGEIDQDQDRRLESLARVIAEITSIHGAATALMQLEPWDFMAVYYDGIDHFGHGFMRYHPPRRPWVDEREFELYSGVIEAAYRYHDMMLGALLALAGGDTTVILMSDHGFHPDGNRPRSIPAEPAGPAVEHRHFGILAMRGEGIPAGHIFGASVLDVCPTILRLFGLPAGRDMDGKVLVTAFEKPPRLETIPSWDDVPGDSGRHAPDMLLDPVESAAAMRQMIELGYIEPLPGDADMAVRQTVRELQYNLAHAYMDGGRLPDAAKTLAPLWDDWPEEHRFGIALAGCLAGMRRPEKRWEVIGRLEANMASAARSAADELARRQQKTGAAELNEFERYELRRLLQLAHPDPGVLPFLKGFQRVMEGDLDQAVAELECGTRLAPDSAALQIRLGYTLLQSGAWDRAEKAFAAALAQDADEVDGHLGIARVKEAAGDWEGMLQSALSATELVFFNPRGHTLVGRALLRLERYDQAEQAFQLALHQSPGFRQALHGLHRLYRDLRPDEFQLNSLKLRVLVLREQLRSQARERRAGGSAVAEVAGAEDRHEEAAPAAAILPAWPDAGQVVTIVSGLPRSGTSMMMQMLAAGGLEPYTDRRRDADEDNPRGYFEHDLAARLASNDKWLPEVRGKAVKIVAPLLPRLPETERYSIVMMRRDLGEVTASQREMLERLGRKGAALEDSHLAAALRAQMARVARWATGRAHVRLLEVEYAQVLVDPAGSARRIAAFLGRPLDLDAMADAVRPELRRQGRRN